MTIKIGDPCQVVFKVDADEKLKHYHQTFFDSGIAQLLECNQINLVDDLLNKLVQKGTLKSTWGAVIAKGAKNTIFNKPNGNPIFREMVKAFGVEIVCIFNESDENIDKEIYDLWVENEKNKKNKGKK